MPDKTGTFVIRLIGLIVSALGLLFALGTAWALLYARVGRIEVRVGALEESAREIKEDVKSLIREDYGVALDCGEED